MSDRAIILLFDRGGLLHRAFIGPHDNRPDWHMAEAVEELPSWEPLTCDLQPPLMKRRTFTRINGGSFATTFDTHERVYVDVYSEDCTDLYRAEWLAECWLESIMQHDFDRYLPYNGPERRRKAQEAKEKSQREFAEEMRRMVALLKQAEGEAL